MIAFVAFPHKTQSDIIPAGVSKRLLDLNPDAETMSDNNEITDDLCGRLNAFEKKTFGISSLVISATITYLWGISKIFESSKGKYHTHPNLIEMLENREKQLFGLLS